MSTHNMFFMENWQKLSFNYHQIHILSVLLVFRGIVFLFQTNKCLEEVLECLLFMLHKEVIDQCKQSVQYFYVLMSYVKTVSSLWMCLCFEKRIDLRSEYMTSYECWKHCTAISYVTFQHKF